MAKLKELGKHSTGNKPELAECLLMSLPTNLDEQRVPEQPLATDLINEDDDLDSDEED